MIENLGGGIKIGGIFRAGWRRNRGALIWTKLKNGVCTPGLNDLLLSAFGGGTQRPAWYIGLIANAGFSSLNPADTMNAHSGWTEAINYDEATRRQWVQGTPSGGSVSNPTVAVFTATSTMTIYGLFLCSIATKSDTTGILWATAAFSGVQTIPTGEPLNVTYTLSCTGS